MNIFDLKVWKRKDITGIYHKWQNMVSCWNPSFFRALLCSHYTFLFITFLKLVVVEKFVYLKPAFHIFGTALPNYIFNQKWLKKMFLFVLFNHRSSGMWVQLLFEWTKRWTCSVLDSREVTAVWFSILISVFDFFEFQNEDRVLWKLGTLPPGLITFYNLTNPLEKTWHVLGLGYNPSIDRSEIESAAVVHYNGNMKPWLELAMTKYRPYWTKYIKYDHPYLRNCNLSEWAYKMPWRYSQVLSPPSISVVEGTVNWYSSRGMWLNFLCCISFFYPWLIILF
jgi:hypothetical protein